MKIKVQTLDGQTHELEVQGLENVFIVSEYKSRATQQLIVTDVPLKSDDPVCVEHVADAMGFDVERCEGGDEEGDMQLVLYTGVVADDE